MSTSMAQSSESISRVVRCETCRSIFRNVKWEEGARCPRCRSPKFLPLPIDSDAVEYTLADRSQGYALEDIEEEFESSGEDWPDAYRNTPQAQQDAECCVVV